MEMDLVNSEGKSVSAVSYFHATAMMVTVIDYQQQIYVIYSIEFCCD